MGEAKRRKRRIFPARRIVPTIAKITVFVICVLAVLDFVARRNVSHIHRYDPNRTVGAPEAELKIVQFIDFQNTECARGAKVLQSFLQKHPKDLLVSSRYFYSRDRNSLIGCVYAECASRQGLFWPYYEELMLKQNQWRGLQAVEPYLTLLARNVFANMEMFKTCLGDIEVKQVVEEDTRLGQAHSLNTVPTYFVNDKKIVGVDDLEKYLTEYFENKRLGLL